MTSLTANPITVVPAVAAPAPDAVSLRRAALLTLDAGVRELLQRRLLDGDPAMRSPYAPVVELTVYDTVYAGTPAGGHWTVAVRRPLLFGHQVAGYTVTLEIDGQDRPARFQVSGASEVVSDDASLPALERALARARITGPLVTWAPSFMPGISL